MDNASFHKKEATQTAIEQAGCILEFLPTYSPDLNPIEHKWAQAKAIRRKLRCSVDEIFQHPLASPTAATLKMSRHIKSDQENLSINRKSANFIYKLLHNGIQRGLSPTNFRLSMSRTDIGNYLGLTLETISRLFSDLEKSGVLIITGRYISIQDSDRLARMSN